MRRIFCESNNFALRFLERYTKIYYDFMINVCTALYVAITARFTKLKKCIYTVVH